MILTECIPWDAAQSRLADDWRDLVERGGFNPSLDPAWMDAAVRSHGCEADALVVAARSGSRLVGVLPMLCRREKVHGLLLRTVDLASNLVSYHPEIVAEQAHRELITHALSVAHGGRWDLFRANQIPDASQTAAILEEYFVTFAGTTFKVAGETSPYILIDGTWEQLLQSRSRNFRSNRNRALRHVEGYGSTATRWFVGNADNDLLLREILEIERRSWKAQQGVAISDREVEQDYHVRLLDLLGRRGALFANVLYVADRPVSYVLGCNWNGWVGHLKTSFDEAFSHVGARVIDESIHRAIEAGAREYDFLGEATRHKHHWTDHVRTHHSYWRYSSTPLARALALGKRVVAALRRR